MKPPFLILIASCLVCACSKPAPERTVEPALPTPAPPAADKAEPAAPQLPAFEDPDDPDEACGQIIVVSYKGAEYATETITRTKEEAKARAEELLQRALKGPDFAALAGEVSDAPSSAPRGGQVGTYKKGSWPAPYLPLEETVHGLKVNEVGASLVEANFGYAIVRRCKVEKASSRHILIRYAGATRAEDTITRTKAQARDLAMKLHGKVTAGEDFAALAKKSSEDSSAKRGGELRELGRGMLAPAYEEALFALDVGGLSSVVESEFGFHIIQRMPDPPAEDTP